jgi:hypothetical protein
VIEAREARILFRTDSLTTPPSTRCRTVIGVDPSLFDVRSRPSFRMRADSSALHGSFILLHA